MDNQKFDYGEFHWGKGGFAASLLDFAVLFRQCDHQSDTCSLLCKSSMQTGSVNPEFHCELTTNLAHEILARVILRSGVPWGLVKTLNFSQLSLAMTYDASGAEFHANKSKC